MTRMNPSAKQGIDSKTWRTDLWLPRGGNGMDGSLGLVDANGFIGNGWAMESYCIAQGAVYDWVTLLCNKLKKGKSIIL